MRYTLADRLILKGIHLSSVREELQHRMWLHREDLMDSFPKLLCRVLARSLMWRNWSFKVGPRVTGVRCCYPVHEPLVCYLEMWCTSQLRCSPEPSLRWRPRRVFSFCMVRLPTTTRYQVCWSHSWAPDGVYVARGLDWPELVAEPAQYERDERHERPGGKNRPRPIPGGLQHPRGGYSDAV